MRRELWPEFFALAVIGERSGMKGAQRLVQGKAGAVRGEFCDG
jgi:hypothetical protein